MRPRRVLLVAVLLIALPLAGCSGLEFGGSEGPDPDPGSGEGPGDDGVGGPITDDHLAEQFETATAGLTTAETDRLRAAVITDGTVTERGERLLAALVAIDELEELDDQPRIELARAVGERGEVSEAALRAIDRVRTGPPAFQQAVFVHGLAGLERGVLDGEALAVGLQPDGYKPGATDLIAQLGADGYSERDLAYLRAVGNLSWSEWRQAERVGLLESAVTDGTVSDETVAGLADQAGDGLLDGYVRALGLDPTDAHEGLARLTLSVAFEGISETEWQYLERAAERSTDPFAWSQAETFVYRDARDGIDAAARDRLADTSGDGLVNGFAARIGVDPNERHERLRPYAEELAAPFDLYTFNDVQYMKRLAELSTDEHLWAQATSFGLLAEDRDGIGFVTIEERRQLREFAPGLLQGTAERIGLTEAPGAADVVANLSAALVEEEASGPDGGSSGYTYTDTEVAYLERIVEIAEHRGHSYEYWAQAAQLDLLEGAVANGTVTDDQLWALQNNASNRLLNGMERAIGTDPERADTSGDGFPDHLVWGPMADLEMNASPTAVDVYLEVEATEPVAIPSDELAAIQELFAEEPTTIDPVRIHTYELRENRTDVETIEEMNDREATRAAPGYGMHYLLFQDRPFVTEDEVAGATQLSRPERPQDRQTWMTVVADLSVHGGSSDSRTATIAHEMGHKFGILEYHFDGVDSFRYGPEEYNSVMNYQVTEELTFSTGPPFDDYEQMAAADFGSHDIDTTTLESLWDEGERPEEPLEQLLDSSIGDTDSENDDDGDGDSDTETETDTDR